MNPKVVIAGSIVLDIEPSLAPSDDFKFEQGKLIFLSDVQMHIGGVVGNTGLAMNKLGIPTYNIGLVGDDRPADIIKKILEEEHAVSDLKTIKTGKTSTSIVLAIPGQDRILMNCRGVSRDFGPEHVNPSQFPEGARLFHFAYPPNMVKLYSNNGQGMVEILQKVKAKHLVTSLDMCFPGKDSPAYNLDWKTILARWLPLVDFFLPSIEEMLIFLDKSSYEAQNEACKGKDFIEKLDLLEVQKIGQELVDMGCPVVCLKLGKKGLYLRTGDCSRLQDYIGDVSSWNDREILFPPCAVPKIVSTKGAGDTAIAGFLAATMDGMNPIEALSIASLTASCCIQTVDAISGIPLLRELKETMKKGFTQESVSVLPNWLSKGRYFLGPADTKSQLYLTALSSTKKD